MKSLQLLLRLIALLCLPYPAYSDSVKYLITDRVVSTIKGSETPLQFDLRGRVERDLETGAFTYKSERTEYPSSWTGSSDELYQVALEVSTGLSQRRKHVVSTKSCFLSQSRNKDQVTLLLDSQGLPSLLRYNVDGVPSNGSCYSNNPTFIGKEFTYTQLTIISLPPLVRPMLNEPPPTTPDGKPIIPPPPKSFLQKYGLYIAGVLLVFLLAPDPPGSDQETK